MKKLLGIVVLGLLLSGNAYAKNRPTLECIFNDADKTTTIFDLNKYGNDDFWIEDENEYSWSSEIKAEGMKRIVIVTIKRKTGLIELKTSKMMPIKSDISVVMDALSEGMLTTGKCKKLEDQNL